MQTPPAIASQDEIGKQLELVLEEVKHLRATCRSNADLKALEDRVKTADDLLVLYRGQLVQEKALNAVRMEAEAVKHAALIQDTQQRIKLYEISIALNKAEIDGLRQERAHLRKMRNICAGIVVALGIALGCAVGN